MHPIITIFCPFSRRWAVDPWLENLAKVQHDPALTNLCIIVDGDEPYIANMCKRFAEEHGYRSFHVKINSNWYPNETKLAIRRMRVADIHNQSKDLINLTDGEYIIGLEDDTVLDRMTDFNSLLEPLLEDSTVGFVEGVQMGRWGANMIGAWDADDFEFPQKIWTMLPPTLTGEAVGKAKWAGFEEITGGGWYGYATRRDLYLNCEYYTSSAQPWGPDVNFGLWLKNKGYKCLINWGLIFGHRDYNAIAYPDSGKYNLVKVIFEKDNLTGKWNRQDHEQTRY